MTVLQKAIHRVNATYQITKAIFHITRTKNFTICMETQPTLNSQSNLKKNGDGAIRLPDYRLYYKATLMKTVALWHKKETQINGIESPQRNP